MLFEDYNYSQYNKFVLVDPNGKPDSEEDADESSIPLPPSGKDGKCKHQDHQSRAQLTDNMLELSVHDSY